MFLLKKTQSPWRWRNGEAGRLNQLEARSHESAHRRQESYLNIAECLHLDRGLFGGALVNEQPYLGGALLTQVLGGC